MVVRRWRWRRGRGGVGVGDEFERSGMVVVVVEAECEGGNMERTKILTKETHDATRRVLLFITTFV
jgi:hypothetical protein